MITLDFKHFFESLGGGAYVPTSWSNSDSPNSNYVGRVQLLPSDDFVANASNIEIPTTEIEGNVVEFLDKSNPMIIIIKDKKNLLHKIATTYEQMKNFQGELPIIKNNSYMKVKLLRNPKDTSINPSSIAFCRVKFTGNSGLRNQYNVKLNGNSFMFPYV
jgi:hypothetical protein